MKFHDQYQFLENRVKLDNFKHKHMWADFEHRTINGGSPFDDDCGCTKGVFFKSRVFGTPNNRGALRAIRAMERHEVIKAKKKDRMEARFECRRGALE